MVFDDPEDVLGVLDKEVSLELPHSMVADTYLGYSPKEAKRYADLRPRGPRLKSQIIFLIKAFKIMWDSFLTKIIGKIYSSIFSSPKEYSSTPEIKARIPWSRRLGCFLIGVLNLSKD